MFHQDRPSSSFQGPMGPPRYNPQAHDFPDVNAPQFRDYGPPPQCPPRTYPSHSGPPAVPSYSTPRSLARMNWDVAKQIITNQRVEVRLDGQGWVIGLALSCLKFFEVISGVGCQVRYTLPHGRGSGDGIFSQADVRPI
ncbi:hypothetical protein DFP72DRAFT_899225 [Ephemerocybe angulata]|uniref:Uncharacterized protein n=1 Tax=Ephemerocybe angulata TaxID=980116 RepID=A0A8H6M4L9_9AGAR|nr:hypothetical protein DFP72DRAFT_899225 [Tulosesus angulatus]